MTTKNELEFTKGEIITGYTTPIYQTSDGTIFYNGFFEHPKRLFVKHGDKEISVNLPRDYDYIGAHGNAMYFDDTGKFYKVTFSPQHGTITMSFLRNQLEDEQVHSGMMCSRTVNGKTLVYRVCDDPESDGVVVDDVEEYLNDTMLDGPQMLLSGTVLCGMQKGKALFAKNNVELASPSARKLCENAIIVEFPNRCIRTITPPLSSFAYFTDGASLITLNVETLEFLPPLPFGIEFHGLGGINDGVLTVLSETEGGNCLATARLPREYF